MNAAKKRTSRRVFVVDDHPMFRKAVADWVQEEPEFEVIGEAGTAAEALSLLRDNPADIVILDISLEGANGLELIKQLRAEHPKIKILVLSMHDENQYAVRALRAGAQGYVMKREPGETIIAALREILSDEIYVSPDFGRKLIYRALQSGHNGLASPLDRLSDRELEVLSMIGRGLSTREIAGKLNLSVKTIESHRLHLKEKLGLSSAPELVHFAVNWTQEVVASSS